MFKSSWVKRIISTAAATGAVFCGTLMASATSYPPQGFGYSSSCSEYHASALTSFVSIDSVEVYSSYVTANLNTGKVNKAVTKSDDELAPSNYAYVSFTAPQGCVSYTINSTHKLSGTAYATSHASYAP